MSKVKGILSRLRHLRKAKGLKQGYLAASLGVDRTTYVRKELGLIPITTEEWVRIAETMSVEPAYFFEAVEGSKKAAESGEKLFLELLGTLRPEEKKDLLKVVTILLKGVRRKSVARALKRLNELGL